MYGSPESKVGYDSASLQYTYSGLENLRMVFGGEFLRESFKDDTISAAHRDTKSLYAQLEWELFDGKVTIIPGARFDDNDDYGEEINPKLSLIPGRTPPSAPPWGAPSKPRHRSRRTLLRSTCTPCMVFPIRI